MFSTLQPYYVHVCFKHRLEYPNVPLKKHKAVVCNWPKDFCDVFLYKKVTLCWYIEWYLYVACTKQSAAFGHVSHTSHIGA